VVLEEAKLLLHPGLVGVVEHVGGDAELHG
jgi:hypothetical protein